MIRVPAITAITLLALMLALAAPAEEPPDQELEQDQDQHFGLGLSEEVIPMLLEEDLPKRTAPLLEIGPPLLGPGKLGEGFTLPTGAVWNPALWIFGAYRTSINYVDSSESEALLEWPHRLDLIFNLQLTGTERLVFNLQPLHRDGRFSGYTHKPDHLSGWEWESELEVDTLFFEGELGEIFPGLDPTDRKGLDIGFAIGRQLIEFQDGIMFNDQIDSLGITRNSLTLPGVSNLRVTALVGWGDLHRGDNREDPDATVWALFSELDTRRSTIEIDIAYVDSADHPGAGGDGLYWGLGSTQRIGFYNTTFRINGSHALDRESPAVSDGTLLFAEISRHPTGTHDVVYLNAFWGIDSYTSAARSPTAGGPLGRTGLMFAAVGLGRFRPALGNRADSAYGSAIGYQRFWDGARTQLVLEAGARRSTGNGSDAVAVGLRLQRKLGRRYLVQVDGYATDPQGEPSIFGLRTELMVRF
jgi:hypothetical protein